MKELYLVICLTLCFSHGSDGQNTNKGELVVKGEFAQPQPPDNTPLVSQGTFTPIVSSGGIGPGSKRSRRRKGRRPRRPRGKRPPRKQSRPVKSQGNTQIDNGAKIEPFESQLTVGNNVGNGGSAAPMMPEIPLTLPGEPIQADIFKNSADIDPISRVGIADSSIESFLLSGQGDTANVVPAAEGTGLINEQSVGLPSNIHADVPIPRGDHFASVLGIPLPDINHGGLGTHLTSVDLNQPAMHNDQINSSPGMNRDHHASDILNNNIAFETSITDLWSGFNDSSGSQVGLPAGFSDPWPSGASGSISTAPWENGFAISQGTPVTPDMSGSPIDLGLGSIFGTNISSMSPDTFVSLPGENGAALDIGSGTGVQINSNTINGMNTANVGVRNEPVINHRDNPFNANNVFNTQANNVPTNHQFVDLVGSDISGTNDRHHGDQTQLNSITPVSQNPANTASQFTPFDTLISHNDISQTNGHSSSSGAHTGVRVDELIDHTNPATGLSIMPKRHRGEHNNLNNIVQWRADSRPSSNNANQGLPIETSSGNHHGPVDVPVHGVGHGVGSHDNLHGNTNNRPNAGTQIGSFHIDVKGEQGHTGDKPRVHFTGQPPDVRPSNNNVHQGLPIETSSGIHHGPADVPMHGGGHAGLPIETSSGIHHGSVGAPVHGGGHAGLPIETSSGIHHGPADVPMHGGGHAGLPIETSSGNHHGRVGAPVHGGGHAGLPIETSSGIHHGPADVPMHGGGHAGLPIETSSGNHHGRVDVPLHGDGHGVGSHDNLHGNTNNRPNAGTQIGSFHIDVKGEHGHTGDKPRVHFTGQPPDVRPSNNNVHQGLPIETSSGIHHGPADVPVHGGGHAGLPIETSPGIHHGSVGAPVHGGGHAGLPIETSSGNHHGRVDVPVHGVGHGVGSHDNLHGNTNNRPNAGTQIGSFHIDVKGEHGHTGDKPRVHFTGQPPDVRPSNNNVHQGLPIETSSGIHHGSVGVPVHGGGHDNQHGQHINPIAPGKSLFSPQPSTNQVNSWSPVGPPSDSHPETVPGSIIVGSTHDGSVPGISPQVHKNIGSGIPPLRHETKPIRKPNTGKHISLEGIHIGKPQTHHSNIVHNSVHPPPGVTIVGSNRPVQIPNIQSGGPIVSTGVLHEHPKAAVPPRRTDNPTVPEVPERRQSLASMLGIESVPFQGPKNTIHVGELGPPSDVDKSTITSTSDGGYGRRTMDTNSRKGNRRGGRRQGGSRRGGGRRRGGWRRGGRRWGRRRGGRSHWRSGDRNVHSHVAITKTTTAKPPARISRRNRVPAVHSSRPNSLNSYGNDRRVTRLNSYGNNRRTTRRGTNRGGLLDSLVRTAMGAIGASRGRVRRFRSGTY